jgi:uncharacterized protein YbaR (Trm112 family)
MNKQLLDILVCPFDKVTSLDLVEFQSLDESANVNTIKESNMSASEPADHSSKDTVKPNVNLEKNDTSSQSSDKFSTIVQEGLLLCKSCYRFYPITEEIPIILPDELRDKKKDIEFLNKWKELIPVDLLKNLKPWSI